MSPVYLQDLLSYKNSMYSFRYDNLVDMPRVCTTKCGKSSFCYEAAGVWNSLPNDLCKVDLGANVQCAKVHQFYLAFAYTSFTPVCFYLLCFALLIFYLLFIYSLL